MENQRIDLRYDPNIMHLKSRPGRKWYFIFWGGMLLAQLFIIFFRISDSGNSWKATDLFIFSLQPLLAITFIVRGIYALKKDQQLFVKFESDKIRFRDTPGKQITEIPLSHLRSVKQHTLGAYFYLENGRKVYLNWEQADYTNIKRVKQQLGSLNSSIQAEPVRG